jgi:hypothetical protein
MNTSDLIDHGNNTSLTDHGCCYTRRRFKMKNELPLLHGLGPREQPSVIHTQVSDFMQFLWFVFFLVKAHYSSTSLASLIFHTCLYTATPHQISFG